MIAKNVFGAINVESLQDSDPVQLDVFHWRPTFSHKIRLFNAESGIAAESTCAKVNSADLTSFLSQLAPQVGVLQALKLAFEFLQARESRDRNAGPQLPQEAAQELPQETRRRRLSICS